MENQSRMSPEDIIDECYAGECDMGQIVDYDTYEESVLNSIYEEDSDLLSEAEELKALMDWEPESDYEDGDEVYPYK